MRHHERKKKRIRVFVGDPDGSRNGSGSSKITREGKRKGKTTVHNLKGIALHQSREVHGSPTQHHAAVRKNFSSQGSAEFAATGLSFFSPPTISLHMSVKAKDEESVRESCSHWRRLLWGVSAALAMFGVFEGSPFRLRFFHEARGGDADAVSPQA